MVTARTARSLFSVCVASRPWSVWTSVCAGEKWWEARSRQLHGVRTIWDNRKQASAGWGSRHQSTSADWGSKKHAAKRKIKLQTAQLMMDAEMEQQLAPLRASCKEQGDLVRKLKAEGAPEMDIKKEVQELKARKKELEDMILKLSPADTFDRAKMNDLIKRRFFYDNSFAIYGGITGQYDYGPMGCDLVDNLLSEWHKHFVIQERMLKVNCSILTPEPVLKASGHVDKFADYMVKDVKTGECFRLDHLIKQHFEKVMADKKTSAEEKEALSLTLARLDGMTMEEMNDLMRKHDMKSPLTGNNLTDATEFNLMFPISIGPSGNLKGFLRPETAQGIFVNFKRLLEYNQGKLPFACAQVGNAYRNEISPRSGLLRVREFTMAEIEHFCDPDDKSHPKFAQVANTEMVLYSGCAQMDGESAKRMTIGEAVHGGLVANETLGYYMARIQQYLLRIGINPKKLRFRQHLSNEMAHYACDCWDAECLTSYGWIECVGCADRSAYDLQQHTKGSGVKMCVERPLKEAVMVDSLAPQPDKGMIGKTFKKDAKAVQEALAALTIDQAEQMDKALTEQGEYELSGFKITRAMIPSFKREQKKVFVEEIVPSVIEPSFGVGRVFYSLLEHSFRVREDDDKRTFFSLATVVAPIKVSVLPLSNKQEFVPFTTQLADALTEMNLSVKIDDSTGSIGRRYARTDEIGIPLGITVDFDTVNKVPHTVTVRERDSTQQVRMPIEEVPLTIKNLADGKTQWKDVTDKWPIFTSQETTK
ncbi:glycine--tRNA ligase-like isoform X2 [Portunus trituberculatus]|uniref:glycine--tRNA ligase-like isoform X2 n=1 Tax=Portunus trituberculatus TaxID=210409 RepID=UPI001E1CE68A|nr:glycine--tRNA ligase-like isoform X2 [Portunus trituberculatus]